MVEQRAIGSFGSLGELGHLRPAALAGEMVGSQRARRQRLRARPGARQRHGFPGSVGAQLDAQQGGPMPELAERRRIDAARLLGRRGLLAAGQEPRGAVIREPGGGLAIPRRAQRAGETRVVLGGRRGRRLVATPAGRLHDADLAGPELLLVRPGQCVLERWIARVAAEEVLAEQVTPERLRSAPFRAEPRPAGSLDAHQLPEGVRRLQRRERLAAAEADEILEKRRLRRPAVF